MKTLLALVLTAVPALADLPSPGGVAFFGLHFIDFSTEGAMNGQRADEVARVAMTESIVAGDLAARGFDLVSLAPVLDDLEKIANPADCNGCDLKLARELDADYALTGEVHKISNLILSFKLVLRDTASGATIRAGAVDIRGNTDVSWQRGMRYLLKNIMFKEE